MSAHLSWRMRHLLLAPHRLGFVLAMLHIGFLWLGLAMLIGGASQWLSWSTGALVLPLGALHALTMGCLASLMVAMVTRVSAGHSGRALVADGRVWTLFLGLQLVTVLRVVAAWPGVHTPWVLATVALAWCVLMVGWGAPMAMWYGQLRPDGREG